MDVAMVTSYGRLPLDQMAVWADEIVPTAETPNDQLR